MNRLRMFTESKKDRLVLMCLQLERISVDTEKGIVFSKVQKGREGEAVELKGTLLRGYVVHTIAYEGEKFQVKRHQIVWLAAKCGIYDRDTLMIGHINGDRTDDRLENLMLMNRKEKARRARKRGSQFSDDEQDSMNYLHRAAGIGVREISRLYGCSKSRVHQLISQ